IPPWRERRNSGPRLARARGLGLRCRCLACARRGLGRTRAGRGRGAPRRRSGGGRRWRVAGKAGHQSGQRIPALEKRAPHRVVDREAQAGLVEGGGGVASPLAHGLLQAAGEGGLDRDRKSTRLNSSHVKISYAVFCLKKKNTGMYITDN